MRKNSILYSFLTLLFLLLHSSGYSQYQTEGLIEYSFSKTHNDDFANTEKIDWREWTKIWFKDSCVIYELRINFETRDQTPKGTVVKKSYPVWRYIYLDLNTMICQDYQNFKDTAKPFCNYSLKLNDTIGIWKFFAPKIVTDTIPGIATMSDTTINNTLFKRIKLLYKYYRETGDYSIYYLGCNIPKNMFHLNRTLDEIFSCCKGTRVELLDKNGKVTGRTEYKVISNKLTVEEENIFKQWHKNAATTKLPLLPFREAIRSCISNYQHENPTITIIPNKKSP